MFSRPGIRPKRTEKRQKTAHFAAGGPSSAYPRTRVARPSLFSRARFKNGLSNHRDVSLGGAKQDAENGLIVSELGGKPPSGAKARVDFAALAARLKSCPCYKAT